VVTKADLTVSTFLLAHHIHKNMCTSKKITRHFQIAFVTITFLMWEKFLVEIGALRNFTHFGGHLKNGCQNDRHFEITLVTITFL
jgi:hypothetical protein